jgi:hypothetical protein
VAFVGGAVAVDPTRTTAGTRVWLASGAEPEIEVRRADGTLERIVRWTPPSRALTDAHIARYREYLLGSTSDPDTRQRHVQFMDGVPMPQQLPALGDAPMHLDTNGHLWAEAYRPPWDAEPEWLVFSPEGEWLGSVRTPVGFVLRDIGADFVLGSWRDDPGVEYVHYLRTAQALIGPRTRRSPRHIPAKAAERSFKFPTPDWRPPRC